MTDKSSEHYAFDKNNGAQERDKKNPDNNIIKLKEGSLKALPKLEKTIPFYKLTYQVSVKALQTDWFRGLAENSQAAILKEFSRFIRWLNSDHAPDENNADFLNAYRDYQHDILKRKHSDVRNIISLIKTGLAEPGFENEEIRQMLVLLRLSVKKQPTPAVESYTLTRWFSQAKLENAIGHEAHRQIESPAVMLLSFRIVIAVTLLYLLEARAMWKVRHIPVIRTGKSKFNPKKRLYKWVLDILEKSIELDDENNFSDALSHVLAVDLIKETVVPVFKRHRNLEKRPYALIKLNQFQKSSFLNPDDPHSLSATEEMLAAWLMACESIQPADISKLKKSDYAIERNEKGLVTLMQCHYYKGRSGNYKDPPILAGDDVWTMSILSYFENINDKKTLFSLGKKPFCFPYNNELRNHNHHGFFLLNLWKSPELLSRIKAQLSRYKASNIFLEAVMALHYAETSVNNDIQMKDTIPKLPTHFFSLSHIKTTAVHSRTDKYRMRDLVNVNSHTSNTEAQSYLSDDNKEWINQCGRITRLVLNDLVNNAFRPSLRDAQLEAERLADNTRIISVTYGAESGFHSCNENAIFNLRFSDTVLVADETDTAVYFLHFISEAEKNMNTVLSLRPDFIFTLLVQVEWASRILNRMASARNGERAYQKIKKNLPDMFGHLYETNV